MFKEKKNLNIMKIPINDQIEGLPVSSNKCCL